MDLATLFIVGFVGAITPGPDILLVLKNTLQFGVWQGLRALCGIASGWLIFLGIIYFGFAHILSGELFQLVLSFVGGLYLLYVAFCLARSKGEVELEADSKTGAISESSLDSEMPHASVNATSANASPSASATPQATAPAGFFKALFINLSNPKAILFFSIMIAPFMDTELELSLSVLFASLASGFLSVILLAAFFSKYLTRAIFVWIDRICALLFSLFATALLYQAYEIWRSLA